MANTMKALQTVTVGTGGAATATFNNIPGIYSDLVVRVSARSAFAGGIYDIMNVQINNSRTVLATRQVYGTGTTVNSDFTTTSTNVGWMGYPQANGATAGIFGNQEIYIPNYLSPNLKGFAYDAVDENNATASMMYFGGALWSNADAITSLSFSSANGANWLEHSTFTLYGVYALENTPSAPTIASVSDYGGGAAQVAIASPAPIPYEVTSSPGGFVGTGQSPVLVAGLTPATAYTFTAKAISPMGNSASGSASSSLTPYKGYVALATAVTNGTTQGVTFSSIPQDYTHLQIRCFVRNGASAPNPDYTLMQINGDTAANYINHGFYTNGSSVTSDMFNNSTYGFCGPFSYNSGAYSTANMWTSIVIDLLDYTNTNKFKAIRSIGGYDANGSGFVGIYSGMWRNTAALTSIMISAANAAEVGNSVYTLYGIK